MFGVCLVSQTFLNLLKLSHQFTVAATEEGLIERAHCQ